ncbi:MAG: hypothetical protein WCK74_10665 [Gemmatimonadaceae bacterium]
MRANALTPRERRVITGGALIVSAALSLTYLVRPFAQRWQTRSAERAEAMATTAALVALASDHAAIERAADTSERALADAPRRILRARSATLGASALQSLVQGAADASHVVLTRVVVSPDSLEGSARGVAADSLRPATQPPSLPLQLSAYGDITGITRFLTVLATGPQLIGIDRVTLQRNSALAGAADVVQVTLTAHAPLWRTDGTAATATATATTRPLTEWRGVLRAAAAAPLTPNVAAMHDAAERVIHGDIFSSTRRAPSVAFVEPGRADATPAAPMAPMATDTAPSLTADFPVLSGIVTVNGERQALLQLRADDGAPRLYRVGSTHAGYQLLAIDRDAVILSGPTGRRTLRLSTRSASASREPLL